MFAFEAEEKSKSPLNPQLNPKTTTGNGMTNNSRITSSHVHISGLVPRSDGIPGVPETTSNGALKAKEERAANEELKVRAKKKQKKGFKTGAPAEKVLRGFHTPAISSGEESDSSPISSPMQRAGSRGTPTGSYSPSLRPSNLSRALTDLRLTTASMDIDFKPSVRSIGQPDECSSENGTGSPASEKPTGEVPLERDFATTDSHARPLYGAVEGGLRHDSLHLGKMSTADFEPLKCLGKGAFGTVILVKQRSTGRLFAQKQVQKKSLTGQRLVEQTKTERTILENVKRHPFVVKLFYAFQDQQKLYLILEYAQGGELFHHLALERTFTEEVAAFYMAEMVLALDHLHRNLGVVYRDLKPENCLLDAEGHLLLTDFGLSKIAFDDPSDPDEESRCNSIVGTLDYMAPEAVSGKNYGPAVDWWSLGALGYDLLTGAPPFTAANYAKIQQKIVHGKVTPPYYLSPDAKDLLVRLLRKEPHKRLGGNMPKDLVTIKNHRFFRKVDWKALSTRDLLAPIQPIITDPAEAENFDAEFTELAISPLEPTSGKGLTFNRGSQLSKPADNEKFSAEDPFGGFSFVASRSLLDSGY